jgi:hypothetical protein
VEPPNQRMMRAPRSRSAILPMLAVALAAAAFSCSRGQQADEEAAAEGVRKRYERGPVTLELAVDRDEVTVADRVELVLRVESPEDYEVRMPSFGEKLEQFGIVDYSVSQPRLVKGGRVVAERSYTLEPFLSGEYVIPPMKVSFWKEPDEEPGAHEIETEEVSITVKSLLPEQAAELDIRGLAGPVELPSPSRWWLPAGAAAALLAAAAAVVVRKVAGAGKAAPVPRIPAHELAFRQLEELLAEDPLARGEVKLFYTRVSDILRHYIENRFGLHAPERTTEEFLRELRTGNALGAGHSTLLERFLEHCDLVKFAEHQPDTSDIQRTFDACKQFITETESSEARVVVQAASWGDT